MAGSALMAVGGAYLTMSAFDAFYFGIVNGRGWICIALVIFASWRPGKALLGALLFAGLDALQVRAQQFAGGLVPYQFFLMLPRSEEHTSELQSLMRISYAVFCLQKKNN